MSRLYIRDFSSKQIGPADLEALFSKICPVEEVYIPESETPTGLVRSFAVVRLQTVDPEIAHKCVKAFNGCLWKGARIRVEKANNEFYKDKFDRERKEEIMDTEESAPTDTEEEKEPSKQFSNSYVKIKKDRHSLPVKISTKPSARNKKRNVASCGKRIVFDIDGNFDNANQTSEESSSSDDEDEEEAKKSSSKSDDHTTDLSAKPTNGEDAQNSSSIVKPVEGGGKRRGFGTLLKEDTSVFEVKAASLIEKEEDDKPCISAEDLSEAALQKERSRALDIMNNMIFTLPTPTVNPKKAVKIAAKQERDAAKLASESLAAESTKPTIVYQQTTPDETENNTFYADFDEDIKAGTKGSVDVKSCHPASATQEASEDQSVSMPAKPGFHQDEFANMNKLKNIFHKEGGVWFGDDGTIKESVGKGCAGVDPLFLEAERLGIDTRVRSATFINPTIAASSVSISGSGTASSGSFNFGFGFGDSSKDDAGGDADVSGGNTSMVFRFFPEMEKEEETNNDGDDADKERAGAEMGEQMISFGQMTSIADLPSTKATTLKRAVDKGGDGSLLSVALALTPNPISLIGQSGVSLQQLVGSAKRFCRDTDTSDDRLDSTWRETRERLVMDYKRKKKDAKKRSLQHATTGDTGGSLNSGTTSAGLADELKQQENSSRGGSAGRGGGAGFKGKRGGVRHKKRGRDGK